jgi:ferric-dicitrate binding protein FerR (iron transport regulator)
MSNHEDSKHDPEGGRQNLHSDDAIARLMYLAGPREAVPADVERRVHDSVKNEWRRSIRRGRTVRWVVPLALAASLVVAIALSYRTPEVSPEAVPRPIATIARINGNADLSGKQLSVGDSVFAGDTITTAVGEGVSLTMNRNLSLRIAAGTTVTIETLDEVELVSGRLYVDSGEAIYPDRHITIHTEAGFATDIGTQFGVSYLRDAMSVAVREGIVDVTAQSEFYTARSGDRLVLKPDSDVVFERIPVYDDSWSWAVALAPAFEIDNRSLFDFLTWAARETGKGLVFADNDVRMAAMRTTLRGSVADFTPVEALESVLATTGFEYQIEDRRIGIGE